MCYELLEMEKPEQNGMFKNYFTKLKIRRKEEVKLRDALILRRVEKNAARYGSLVA